jgi:hypothetical protein
MPLLVCASCFVGALILACTGFAADAAPGDIAIAPSPPPGSSQDSAEPDAFPDQVVCHEITLDYGEIRVYRFSSKDIQAVNFASHVVSVQTLGIANDLSLRALILRGLRPTKYPGSCSYPAEIVIVAQNAVYHVKVHVNPPNPAGSVSPVQK